MVDRGTGGGAVVRPVAGVAGAGVGGEGGGARGERARGRDTARRGRGGEDAVGEESERGKLGETTGGLDYSRRAIRPPRSGNTRNRRRRNSRDARVWRRAENRRPRTLS